MIPFSKGERVSEPGPSKDQADEFERKDRIIRQMAKEILNCIFISITLRISLLPQVYEKSYPRRKNPQIQILKNRAAGVFNQMGHF
jgi:hypothetical protein